MSRPIKVALLTNIVAPYRVPIYNALAKRFSLQLLYSGKEDNRGEWAASTTKLRGVRAKRSTGISIKYFAARSGEAYDDRYLHINPGYLFDLMKQRPHAVVSTELGFRTLCAHIYCSVTRVPLLVWWEGSVFTERDIGVVRRVLRRAVARHVSWWLSGGENATQYLRTLGVPDTRVVRAQNAVDEQLFAQVVTPPRFLGRRPVLLVVGRLVPGKGVGLLLDAVAKLKADGLKFSVAIVGDGRERPKLERQVAELGLTDVEFHLSRPLDEMPSYYRGADFLVLPTLHDVWGLVVNEAMWSGIPVLVSKYAGCADELLPPGQIFDPLDLDDFGRKLRRAIEDGLPAPDTSRLMKIQQVADAIGDSIDELLERPRNRERLSIPVKRAAQQVIRRVHVAQLDRGLPQCVAAEFHRLPREQYARFEEMITYFRNQGYVVTDPEGFVSEAGHQRRLFISFDDNFQDWHEALPLFGRLDLKCTFYVNAYPLRDRATDRNIEAYVRRVGQPAGTKPLSSAELRAIAADGHTIGSHSYSHLLLTALPLAFATAEIHKGRVALEQLLGTSVPHFSYPFGMARHFSPELREYCRGSGFRTIANGISGRLHAPQERLNINRTGWILGQPLKYNLENIRVDGALFERLTGRSAVG